MMNDGKAVILIVDDKPSNIVALEGLLSTSDRVLINADSGNQALKIALNNAIDLIILDVQMPQMDGFEVAQILKSNKKTKDIPIIFASAEKKEHASMVKGFEEGAIDYLFKPLDPEITKAKVSVLLKVQLQKKELMEKNTLLEMADEKIRQLNISLQRNISQLEAANKELESFSYSVSHDLRAPLRALDGNARILEEDYGDKLNSEAKAILEKIRHNTDRMNRLINDLLSFSKIGKKALSRAEINVAEQVRTIIDEFGHTMSHKATIRLGELPNAVGDYAMLNQVWTNLLSNAIKYSAKKKDPEIEIGALTSGGEVVYYVKDNGAGFDMAYAGKLFGTFQRLHDDTEFEGTGIGLAIVQRIVLKHGGSIRAEGVPEKGATFYFTLPGEV